MAKKKKGKKPSSKKAVRKASRKLGTKKAVARKRAKPRTVKVAPRKRVKKPLVAKRSGKSAAVKKAARKKPLKRAEPLTTQIVHSAEPQPVPPPVALPPKPAVAVSPAPAAAVRPFEAPSERPEVRPTGFHPGQRVRHRYEHWWGTIVEKLENPPGTESAPAPTRYIVTVDGGALRDDIRPEDLTGI
jgi:hypothetical protein